MQTGLDVIVQSKDYMFVAVPGMGKPLQQTLSIVWKSIVYKYV